MSDNEWLDAKSVFKVIYGSRQALDEKLPRDSSTHCVRWLRGERMDTVRGVFDEFAAALQFPWYFGFNKDAFDECLTDLSWLTPCQAGLTTGRATRLEIVIFDIDRVLRNESQERSWFKETMVEIRSYWLDQVKQEKPARLLAIWGQVEQP